MIYIYKVMQQQQTKYVDTCLQSTNKEKVNNMTYYDSWSNLTENTTVAETFDWRSKNTAIKVKHTKKITFIDTEMVTGGIWYAQQLKDLVC